MTSTTRHAAKAASGDKAILDAAYRKSKKKIQLPVRLDIDSPPAKMLHIVQNLRSSPKCLLTSHDARFSRPAPH